MTEPPEAPPSELPEAFDAIGVGSWSYDLRSGRIVWSQAVRRLFGVEVPPATYDAYLDLIHPDDREALGGRVRSAFAAGDEPYHVLHRVVRPDGAVRWSMGRGRVLRDADGQPCKLEGISWDVTEREEARERAERVASRLALLVEVNDAFAQSEGWEEPLRRFAEALVPAHADWCAVDAVGPEGQVERVVVRHADAEKIRLAERLEELSPYDPENPTGVARVLREAAPVLVPVVTPAMVEATMPPGPARDLVLALGLTSYLAVPIAAHGTVHGVLTLVMDGSGRRFDDDDVKLAQGLCARVALAVEQRRTELERERLLRALARSNEELDRFAYVTSHDLKAPLRGIASLASFLEEDLGAALADEPRKHLTLLKGRVKRLESLIDAMLTYARAGGRPDLLETLDLHELAQETVELVAGTAASRVVLGALPVIEGERVPLQQVLMNLATNALRHGGDGEVRIEGAVRNGFVEVRVADRGPGVPEAYRERVWGLFQTLRPRDEVESTGIGLAVVRKLVDARGGRAWVEETPGGGATFAFTWPAAEGAGAVGAFDTGRVAAFDPTRIRRTP